MLQKTSGALFLVSMALLVSACSPSSAGPGPTAVNSTPTPAVKEPPLGPATSTRFVKASVRGVEIPAGGSVAATVTLTIQSGYHVNANPPTFPYLRATEVVVQTSEGISVGFITYPKALTKTFSFAEKPLAVYEGEVPIKVMLKASPSASKGVRSLPIKLNIQACDDQVCYAPGTLELSLSATVK